MTPPSGISVLLLKPNRNVTTSAARIACNKSSGKAIETIFESYSNDTDWLIRTLIYDHQTATYIERKSNNLETKCKRINILRNWNVS